MYERNNLPANLYYLQVVLANLSSAILLEDEHRNILLTNESFTDLFNIPLSPVELQEYSSWEIYDRYISPFAQEDIFAGKYNSAKDESPHAKQYFHLTDERIISLQFTPVSDQHDGLVYLWTFNDETEEIRILEEAQAKKVFYEDVLNNLPSDIAVFSPEHRYLFLNPVAIRDPELRKWMIGKTDVDYCLLKNKDLSIADTRKKIYEDAIASKQGIEWEEQLTTREGQPEYHLRRMSPIYDENGQMKMLIGYGLNINERKKIEHQIQLSEKRYRDLFNYSKAIIFTHDLDGKILTVNPAFCERTGYVQEELIGRSLKQILNEEDQGDFDAVYLKEFDLHAKARGIFKILNKEGRKIYCLYENFKVCETDEAPYIIGFAQDVTERIKAEEELREAKRLTEETAKVKEVFLANMSHEIRTPMNGIIGISNILERTNLTPGQKNYLKIINDSAKTLLNIINDVLDIEKIASGEVQIESIPFDIVNTTTSIIRLFEHTGKEKNVELIFRNDIGENLAICGDPTRFSQIMNNLLSNAIKFTPKGSITVNARVENETEADFTLQFSVLDTGIGIPEDGLIKIFKPYIQASPETARKYGGTGLGLAITKNLIELQQGHIWVESKPNQGSKFTFNIRYTKLKPGQQIETESEETPSEIDFGNIKVLLAEDNEVNQLLAQNILGYWGLQSKTAATGVEVMKLMREEDFDIVLMDIQMPEKNGIEAAAEIRKLADPRKRNIPIIALTAIALKGEEQKYIAVGMDDFLTKPFKERELHTVISRVLKNKGAFGRNLFTEGYHKPETIRITKAPAPPTTEVEKLYDMCQVTDLARGSHDFVVTLTKIFIDTVPLSIKEMQQAAKEERWDAVSKFAHKIKPTIDTMCMYSIKEDVRTIEHDAKNGLNLDNIPVLINKLEQVITEAVVQLKQEYSIA